MLLNKDNRKPNRNETELYICKQKIIQLHAGKVIFFINKWTYTWFMKLLLLI